MTLSMFNAPGPIGPGSLMTMLSSGPIPTGDWFRCDVFRKSDNVGIAGSAIIYRQQLHIEPVIGYDESVDLFFGSWESVPDGTPVGLFLTHFRSTGFQQEQATDLGAWTWTLRSPWSNLLQFVAGGANMQAVLNAVQRTPTVPGQR